MSHVRQQVRDAFKSALSGLPGVVSIHGIRTDHFAAVDLPAVQVTTPQEVIRPLDSSDTETDRDIQVDVSIWALGDEGVDDALDDIAAEIETRILTATGGIWNDDSGVYLAFPTSATMTLGELAEKTAVVLTTRFRVQLQASDPQTIGD